MTFFFPVKERAILAAAEFASVPEEVNRTRSMEGKWRTIFSAALTISSENPWKYVRLPMRSIRLLREPLVVVPEDERSARRGCIPRTRLPSTSHTRLSLPVVHVQRVGDARRPRVLVSRAAERRPTCWNESARAPVVRAVNCFMTAALFSPVAHPGRWRPARACVRRCPVLHAAGVYLKGACASITLPRNEQGPLEASRPYDRHAHRGHRRLLPRRVLGPRCALSEISIETGLATRGPQPALFPRGAGNVVNNLVAMGVRNVSAFGVLGTTRSAAK